ncbi:MAG: hypothetical protein MRZ79_23785 [Bacteroidia bacterium]|nr:hypothetical protein [Bacteroidia bacterium]
MKKLEKLEILAEGFGRLKERVVFCGGMLTSFYATDSYSQQHRSMGELMCILNAPTMAEFFNWDHELRKHGFSPKYDPQPPVVEWEYKGVSLDIYPSRPEIVRHPNRWFEEGLFHAVRYPLPSGKTIRMMPAPYFLACRIEEFLIKSNFRLKQNKDFEDIIYLLNNRQDLQDEIQQSFYEVRAYIQNFFLQLLEQRDLKEGLYYAIPYHEGENGISRIMHIIEEIVQTRYAVA